MSPGSFASAIFLLAALLHAPVALAQDDEESQDLSAAEIDEIVGPIALYPDDLLAIVLPASTYPLQIVQASRFLEKHKADDSLKPDEEWDESVIGLLNYPEVIAKMNEDLDWTWKLGEAVADQQGDVMDGIQRFRGKADEAGNLESNDKMTITKEEQDDQQVIVIQSASSEVIYVPVYQPSTVVVYQTAPYPWYYSPPYPYYYRPAAAFWTGMFVGVAVGYGMRWGYGHHHSSIKVTRNVNINVDRPDLGGGIGDRDRPGDRGGAGDWKADKGRGKQSGARPGREGGSRPGTGAATRPSGGAGARPGGGAGSKPAARPSTGDRAGGASDRRGSSAASTRDRSSTSRDRASSTRQPSSSRSRDSSFGGYKSGSAARSHSSRGYSSRGGGSRGGSRGGGGRRR